jgi:hypothetical protein
MTATESIFSPTKTNFIYRKFAKYEKFTSNIAFFPYEVSRYSVSPERLQEIQDFIDLQSKIGRRTVLLLAHDYDRPMSKWLNGNPIVFRYSMSKVFDYVDEYIIPPKVDSFRETFNFVNVLPWNSTPRITFMGWSAFVYWSENLENEQQEVLQKLKLKSSVKASPLIFPTPFNTGVILRKRAMDIIQNDPRIDCNFVINDRYFYQHDQSTQTNKRDEYLESIRDTHYVLTIRGSGNYSIRLFETFAAGRIPVMIDSKQHLPFEDLIPWKEIGVWVPFEEFERISDYICEFHNKIGESGFLAATQRLSQTFEEFLSRDATLVQIEKILERYI